MTRVGVYIDGFNLYYGARGLCGKGTPGWRWLDLRALSQGFLHAHSGWSPPFDLRDDVLGGGVDAAVVISNDSDLTLPVSWARERVPVGLVNPTRNWPAGALNGDPHAGAGSHWWHQLTTAEIVSAQLPTSLGRLSRPAGW